mgnify:CR=1 FL=1
MVVYHELSRMNQSKTEVFDWCKGVHSRALSRAAL